MLVLLFRFVLQVNRTQKSSNRCRSTPRAAYGRQGARSQPQHAFHNSNSTFLNLLDTIERQACINDALLDEVRQEKANNAILDGLLQENMDKINGSNGYKQSLATVTVELSRTTQTLEYATGDLHALQDELQQADDCIQDQAFLLQEGNNTIGTLQAQNDAFSIDKQELERRNEFIEKQLAYERATNKGLMAELKVEKEKLAAAKCRNTHLTESRAALQAVVAGNLTPMVSAAVAGDNSDEHFVWLTMLLVLTAIQSCVMLHIIMLSTVLIKLFDGLTAAPWLFQEAKVWGVVCWGLVYDLSVYLGVTAAKYCSGGYVRWAGLVKATGTGAAAYLAGFYVGCVGLLSYAFNSGKSLVRSGRCASLNLWPQSSEKLLSHWYSWASTPVGSQDVTPTTNSRSSMDADAVHGSVHDVAGDARVLVSLKEGMVLAKDHVDV